MTRHLVVVGGGVTGLAAAWEASSDPDVSVTVLEATGRVGGKVRTSVLELPTGPVDVDEGADNFLAREPEVVDLCTELGLADQLTQPALGRAKVWVPDGPIARPSLPATGRLRWLPTRQVLGVPIDADDLAAAGILSPTGLTTAAAEVDCSAPAPSGDVSIGSLLASHYGDELVERVVGPLVGGINAGDVHELSLRAVTPQLAAAAAEGGSLTLALRRRLAAATTPSGPVFRALLGGTEVLGSTLEEQLRDRGVSIRTGARVESIRRTPDGVDGEPAGRIEVALTRDVVSADAVVVAVPAPLAARVLEPLSPAAATELDRIMHVPVVFTTLAFRRDQVGIALDASGVLIPRGAGLLATAISFGSLKWPQWDDGTHVVLRIAAGHRHDDRPARMDDDELVAGLLTDLGTVLGIVAPPVTSRVSRWSPGFAQYQVGHLDLVERVQVALERDAPAVRVAGGDLGGLGLPACVRQGRAAARLLLG